MAHNIPNKFSEAKIIADMVGITCARGHQEMVSNLTHTLLENKKTTIESDP